MTKLLIDGDLICYRAGFATDKTKYAVIGPAGDGLTPTVYAFVDDAATAKKGARPGIDAVWSRKDPEPEDKALMLVDVMIRDIKERYAAENPTVHLFLTGVGNFRHSVATRASYKGNRSGSTPPVHLKAIRAHLASKYGAELSSGQEADDDIGIAMTANPGSVCVSIDKDLMQLAGRHYNFVTKEEVTVSAKEAVINLYAQVLSGDATDNIPGLTGYGPVKARKALEDCKSPHECWRRALYLYGQEFNDDPGFAAYDYAFEAASLVYVLRESNKRFVPPNAPKATEAKSDKKESRSVGIQKRARSGNSSGLNVEGSAV